MEQKNETLDKICEQVDKSLKTVLEQKVQPGNADYLYKLIDVKKDIIQIKGMEDDSMMYRGYDNYGREDYGNYGTYAGGRSRDSRGRYMGNDRSYGRRYRGHDYIDDMAETYGTYMENRENGRYGSPEMDKALDFMLKSVEDFMKMLKQDASSQEEVEKIRRTAKRISEM